MTRPTHCANPKCGKPLEQPSRGRPRKFCPGEECRNAVNYLAKKPKLDASRHQFAAEHPIEKLTEQGGSRYCPMCHYPNADHDLGICPTRPRSNSVAYTRPGHDPAESGVAHEVQPDEFESAQLVSEGYYDPGAETYDASVATKWMEGVGARLSFSPDPETLPDSLSDPGRDAELDRMDTLGADVQIEYRRGLDGGLRPAQAVTRAARVVGVTKEEAIAYLTKEVS